MNGFVIDSSGWLEYFTAGRHAKAYLKYFHSNKPIWTPSLVIYEVYKKILREKSDADAILAITQIEGRSEEVVPLDDKLAIFAADLSLRWKLPMADAIIYATAIDKKAVLVSGDLHFKDLDGVVLIS